MDKVEIDKNKIISLYKSSDEKCKKLLENIFGEKWLEPSIQERIKTFEDACEELGENHYLVEQWEAWKQTGVDEKATNAYMKLCIIVATLNEGWHYDFIKKEPRYYPYFVFYHQEDIYRMKEEGKDISFCKYSSSLYPRGVLVYSGVLSEGMATNRVSGVYLALKSIELAEYAGKQFINIYREFVTGM